MTIYKRDIKIGIPVINLCNKHLSCNTLPSVKIVINPIVTHGLPCVSRGFVYTFGSLLKKRGWAMDGLGVHQNQPQHIVIHFPHTIFNSCNIHFIW